MKFFLFLQKDNTPTVLGREEPGLDFAKIWKKLVCLMVFFTLVPLLLFMVVVARQGVVGMEVVFWMAGIFLVSAAGIFFVSALLVSNMYLAHKKYVQDHRDIDYENRLATIARLAAGVAHEINNPLAVINQKAGLVKDIFSFSDTYSHDERLMELLDSIISSVSRCGNITHRLLAFARTDEDAVKSIHVRDLIADVLEFTTRETDCKDIDIQVDIPEDLPPMECNKGKMQQVFMDLISNALSAMGEGPGKLTISARQKDDAHCMISVEDSGCGISEEDARMIFEPFFSKQSVQGKGPGLGLSITHNLVCEAGGSIYFCSEIDKGTTFMVTLPYGYEKGRKYIPPGFVRK